MDWNCVEGNWKQMKGKVKEKWGQLTDDDLDVINGRLPMRVNSRSAFLRGGQSKSEPVIKYNQHQIEFDCEAHGWAFATHDTLSRKIRRLEGFAKKLTPDDPRHALLAQIKYYSVLTERPTSAGRRQPSPRLRRFRQTSHRQ